MIWGDGRRPLPQIIYMNPKSVPKTDPLNSPPRPPRGVPWEVAWVSPGGPLGCPPGGPRAIPLGDLPEGPRRYIGGIGGYPGGHPGGWVGGGTKDRGQGVQGAKQKILRHIVHAFSARLCRCQLLLRLLGGGLCLKNRRLRGRVVGMMRCLVGPWSRRERKKAKWNKKYMAVSRLFGLGTPQKNRRGPKDPGENPGAPPGGPPGVPPRGIPWGTSGGSPGGSPVDPPGGTPGGRPGDPGDTSVDPHGNPRGHPRGHPGM